MTEFLKPEVKKMLMQTAGNMHDMGARQVMLDGRLTEIRDGVDRVTQDMDLQNEFILDHFRMVAVDLKRANDVIAKQERTQRFILATLIAATSGVVWLLFL